MVNVTSRGGGMLNFFLSFPLYSIFYFHVTLFVIRPVGWILLRGVLLWFCRRREPLGGSGGMPPHEILQI